MYKGSQRLKGCIILIAFLMLLYGEAVAQSPQIVQPNVPQTGGSDMVFDTFGLEVDEHPEERTLNNLDVSGSDTRSNVSLESPEGSVGQSMQWLEQGEVSLNSLELALSVDASDVHSVEDVLSLDPDETRRLLSERNVEAWVAIRNGQPATIELDKLVDNLNIPPRVLSRGIRSYAIYDSDGEFVKLVLVPWSANVDSYISSVAEGLGDMWTAVQVGVSWLGEQLESVGEKIAAALTGVKEWACSVKPRPVEITVIVDGKFDLSLVSFGGAAGATYLTKDLCGSE